MSQNRGDRQGQVLATPIVAEVLRQSCESGKDKEKDEGKMPLFWRVFGGTVLSITALVVMTAYQSLTGSLGEVRNEMGQLGNDLRKEVNRLNETQGELVGKEEMGSRLSSMWRNIRELQEDRRELQTLKERCALLVTQMKASKEDSRRLQQEVQRLREEHALGKERSALLLELSSLRERLAGLEHRHQPVRTGARPGGD